MKTFEMHEYQGIEKKKVHRLTAVELQDMACDYQNGMSITALSVKYDVHRNTVRRNLQKLGIVLCDERTIPHSISEKLTTREKNAIDKFFYKHMSVSEIASAVGVSVSQVKYYLKREKML